MRRDHADKLLALVASINTLVSGIPKLTPADFVREQGFWDFVLSQANVLKCTEVLDLVQEASRNPQQGLRRLGKWLALARSEPITVPLTWTEACHAHPGSALKVSQEKSLIWYRFTTFCLFCVCALRPFVSVCL